MFKALMHIFSRDVVAHAVDTWKNKAARNIRV